MRAPQTDIDSIGRHPHCLQTAIDGTQELHILSMAPPTVEVAGSTFDAVGRSQAANLAACVCLVAAAGTSR